jgi:hypothetical protein
MCFNLRSSQIFLTIIALLSCFPIQLSIGSELNEIQPFFDRSPRLIRSATSYRNPGVKANYYLTIELPADAGRPLESIAIAQQPNLETIAFYPDDSRAFLGEENSDRPTPVKVESKQEGKIAVLFEKPLEPGQKVTISLKARNPIRGGIYQFAITAFPEGNRDRGLSLGVARLHFSQPSGRGV